MKPRKPRKIAAGEAVPMCKRKLHALTGDNLKIGSRGERICISCRAAYMKEYMRKYWHERPELKYGDIYKTGVRDRSTDT